MIFALEILLTVGGLFMLITSRNWGKNPVRHPHYRLLGGFMLTVLPAIFVVAFGFGVWYALTHPGVHTEEVRERLHGTSIGIEVGVVVLYVIVACPWERSIRRKAEALAAAEVEPPSELPAP